MNDPFERAVWRERFKRKERRTRHVAAGFRIHTQIFMVVNAGLILVWLLENAVDDLSSWHDPWFLYSFVGWSIGLAFHWWHVRVHIRRDESLRARFDAPEAMS